MRGIKKREESRWKRIIIFIALLFILALFLNSVNGVYKKKKRVDKVLVQMKKKVSELEKRNEFLKELLKKLKTKEGIEFEIRKKLDVAGAGEKVAIIVEGEKNPTVLNLKISTWQKIKNFFSDLF